MSIRIEWANSAETVLTFTFSDRWTAQNLYLATSELCKMIEERPYPIHTIIDVGSPINAPKNLLALLRATFKKFPSNVERAIIISKSSFWNGIFSTLNSANAIPFPYQYVRDTDDAYGLLEEYVI